ncbi:hypothetical protein F7R20_10175 [Pseudomonas brassicacearum subsp. brassicacearum]|nr:hypothetical protein F7R20_10175 [Pseudomonas brassicacearum subsp. brassicacearum]QEO80752.1 hypothetical protein ELZ14_25590 [Pseudomonas brassicacearum]
MATIHCGSELARDGGGSAALMLTDTTPSRAGSLPQAQMGNMHIQKRPAIAGPFLCSESPTAYAPAPGIRGTASPASDSRSVGIRRSGDRRCRGP